MKSSLISCVVLLALAGTACNKDTKPAKQDEPPKKTGTGATMTETPKKPGDDQKEAPAPTVSTEKATADLGGGVSLDMVLIPAGEFMMGNREFAKSTAGYFNRTYGDEETKVEVYRDEHPQHLVRITRPFYMGTSHVTRGQFKQFVAETGYKTDAEKGDMPGSWGWNPEKEVSEFIETYNWQNVGFEQTDDHPVVNVSWNDAVAFCDWLSKKEGKTYRLPTEAEWEYACRAGTKTRYYISDDPEDLARVGNVADAALDEHLPGWDFTIRAADGYVFTAPVRKFQPNTFGLYDMHGNAWQWCADWYDERYYSASPENDPTGPQTGTLRVLRGGAWFNGPYDCRSTVRNAEGPDYRLDGSGFRVVRSD